MKIIKDGHLLEVSQKAFEVIYASHGYTEYLEPDKPAKPKRVK